MARKDIQQQILSEFQNIWRFSQFNNLGLATTAGQSLGQKERVHENEVERIPISIRWCETTLKANKCYSPESPAEDC